MKKSYFLGLILFIAIISITLWFSMLSFSGILIYIDFLSLFIVLFCPMVLLISNYTLSEVRRNFTIGFKKDSLDPVELKNGLLFFTTLQIYFILSGLMGVFIGIIAVLANLGNPEEIGGGLALCLITVLYSIILSMGVSMPFKTGLQKRLNEISK